MTIKFQAKTFEGWTVDSPLQVFRFPDGATHIKGADAETRYQYQIADVRGLYHADYITLMQWADVCRARGERTVLLLPYLPGARSDRGLPVGADTYSNLINSIGADKVLGLDPHSPYMPSLIRRYVEFPFERIIKNEIADRTSDTKPNPGYVGVIAPDKGAVGRATRAARVLGVPVYTAGKTRDFETGRLTGFHMEDPLPKEGRLLLVDDICDGGGTFVGLAQAIHSERPDVVLDLWVTHGIFSKGFGGLEDHFDTIHTTNSFFGTVEYPVQSKLLADCNVKIHDITPYLYAEMEK